MKKFNCDVLIIGAGPAGTVCASTAKMHYPEKEIVVVKEFEKQLVPCAIPYMFGETLGSSEKNLAPGISPDLGITTLVTSIDDVDTKNKTARSSDCEITYDKLVFATGSTPFVHHSLEACLAYEGVFTVPKNKAKLDRAKAYVDGVESVVVVGTGFIGIEMVMEFAQSGKKVTVIGETAHILEGPFDPEIALEAEEEMLKHGVEFIAEDKVVSVSDDNGSGVVSRVHLSSGKVVETEALILATGYQSNSALAQKAGLKIEAFGGIAVNEYMQTDHPDIFAVGDCAARRGFLTNMPSRVMLASTSASEGRIAGSSLFHVKYIKGFHGTIAIFSTMVGSIAFASAGVTESQANASHADIVVGTFTVKNRHPGTIPGAQKQFVKLIAARNGGQIIGGQLIGGTEVGEMINVIGVMIEAGLTIYQVMSMQVATQPLLTSAPTNYPIIMAAIKIANTIEKS